MYGRESSFYRSNESIKYMQTTIQKFEIALQELINEKGADIHIREDRPVFIRVNRQVRHTKDNLFFNRAECIELIRHFLSEDKVDSFSKGKNVDFSTVSLARRMRGNAFVERGKIGIVTRLIPEIQNFTALNLPDILKTISLKEQGFFLVTGSVGNGKSTTMAAMISMVNANKQKHIITIEDPIEFFYEDGLSFIDQREVGIDVDSFEDALKNALRQDADMLVVGEMRNRETIAMAITAAQTGHYVLSTLHTNSAAQSIERIVDVFPAESQKEIRVELSVSLLGIFSQRLIPNVDGVLIPAYELMLNTPAISHLIREGRVKDIEMTIENSSKDGHISLNRCLSQLYFAGKIKKETALDYATDRDTLLSLLG
jgi:twitching motility protein PilT